MDQLDALRAGRRRAHRPPSISSSRAAFGSLEPGSSSLSRTTTFSPWKAPGRELGLEPDGVVDEHDVVDQELGQLEVAGRLGAAQADREERHALARGQLGGLGERLALGGLAVGKQHDRRRRRAAQLGKTWRTPSPSRDLAARGLDRRAASSTAPVEVVGPVDLGQQAAPRSRRGRAGPCAASPARGAAWPGPSGSSPWRSSSRVVCCRRLATAFASARDAAASASSAALTSGFSYWSAMRSLAESSTMIVRYGSPVRSTERTASESMNIARSTSAIRSAGQHDLGRGRRLALVPVEPDDQAPRCPSTVKTSSHCGHGCSKRMWG